MAAMGYIPNGPQATVSHCGEKVTQVKDMRVRAHTQSRWQDFYSPAVPEAPEGH